MMSLGWTRALTALALTLALGTLAALPAFAQTKSKSIRTEGEWVRYDADAKVAVVKVTKPGEGVGAARLRRGKEAEFAVKPEGSVLTRTTVAIRGIKADITARLQDATPRYARLLRDNLAKQQARDRAAAERSE